MKQGKHLFDNKQNVRRVIYLLYIICTLLLIADFIINRHASHPLETIPGFYPLYGFIGCVLLVIIAKWLRKLIKRSEDYYTTNASKRRNNEQQKQRQSHVDS